MARDMKNLLSVTGLMVAGDIGPYTTYTNKRGKIVFFDRAPPLSPPSTKQLAQRAIWWLVAYDWRQQTLAQKATWEKIVQRCSIRMTGYNLFVAMETKQRARKILPTLLRQAKLESAPPITIRSS